MKPATLFSSIFEWLSPRFELSRKGTQTNVGAMEGMRGFAVFLVFLVHFVTLVEPWIQGTQLLAFAQALHAIGNTGVDLFFVLSGYLIYGSLISREQQFLSFMGRRIVRIYPTFLAVLLLYLFLSVFFQSESKLPPEPLRAVLYIVQNILLLPGLFPIQPIITVAWSLSYEMFFYLLIPLVISIFSMRNRSPGTRTNSVLAVAITLALVCGIFGGPIRFIMFLAGMLLYETSVKPWRRPPTSVTGAFAMVAGLVSTLLPLPGVEGYVCRIAILSVAFFLFCYSCFAFPNDWLAKIFRWWPARWLGNMSYSYYLIHGLALKAMFLVLPFFVSYSKGGDMFFWSLLPLAFIGTLLPSALLFLWIERPMSLDRHK